MTVATIQQSHTRTLILTMDQQTALELARIGGGVLGGALGIDLFRRWFDSRNRKRREPVELTAKLIDDGDEMRRLLLERVTHLEAQHAQAVERAHRAEIELAQQRPEIEKLRRRLERKDECCKALTAQLLAAGIAPVLYTDDGRETR